MNDLGLLLYMKASLYGGPSITGTTRLLLDGGLGTCQVFIPELACITRNGYQAFAYQISSYSIVTECPRAGLDYQSPKRPCLVPAS